MLYAQTGIRAFGGANGCRGHLYEDRADQGDPHMSIHCSPCERYLREHKDPLWAASPHEVPMTELEERTAERQKAETDAMASQGMAGLASLFAAVAGSPGLVDALAKAVGAGGGQPAIPGPEAVPPAVPAEAGTPAAKPKTTRTRKATAPGPAAKTGAKAAA